MLTLPISVVVALVLGFLILRLWASDRHPGPLLWLVGACAVQSLILAMAQHYGIAPMRLVQPITAAMIPGVAWLAFIASAVRPLLPRDALHLAGPGLALVALLGMPALLDALIPALFLGYGLAIAMRCLKGPDALPQMRLEAGRLPTRIWIVIAVTLGLSAFSDVLIVAIQAAGAGWAKPLVISLFSAVNLLVIGGLSLTHTLEAPSPVPESEPGRGPEPKPAPPVEADATDQAAMDRLTQVMARDQLYLDPDLTLTKLARKTGISAKTLSAAINRSTGQSVSRYVNDARIAHVQAALLDGTSVTSAMFDAGFNTKSNFNREFLRVAGSSPTAWLKANGPG